MKEVGIAHTKVSDIAAANMSKSTLYVYFNSKEEIKDYLSYNAMEYFYHELVNKINVDSMSMYEKYMAICHILVKFKENYPLNFQLIVEEISVEDSDLAQSPILRNIYELGEKSNKFIYECMKETQKVQMDSGKEQELF